MSRILDRSMSEWDQLTYLMEELAQSINRLSRMVDEHSAHDRRAWDRLPGMDGLAYDPSLAFTVEVADTLKNRAVRVCDLIRGLGDRQQAALDAHWKGVLEEPPEPDDFFDEPPDSE